MGKKLAWTVKVKYKCALFVCCRRAVACGMFAVNVQFLGRALWIIID